MKILGTVTQSNCIPHCLSLSFPPTITTTTSSSSSSLSHHPHSAAEKSRDAGNTHSVRRQRIRERPRKHFQRLTVDMSFTFSRTLSSLSSPLSSLSPPVAAEADGEGERVCVCVVCVFLCVCRGGDGEGSSGGGRRDETAMRWRIKTGREGRGGERESARGREIKRLALGCRSASPQCSPWELRHWWTRWTGVRRAEL